MSGKWRLILRFRAALLLSCASFGCTDFPTIPNNECGNGVIEENEDCDSFPLVAGTVCRQPGTDDECHLDCSVHEGIPTKCPAGWGCDSSAVCRRPLGEDFEPQTTPVDAGAWSLAAGDFDGDHRGDVMSLEPLDSIGATRVRFYYFDGRAQLEATREFPRLVASPVIKDISGDGLSDVAFAAGPVGVMLGHADRTWFPETFSSYRVPDARVRVMPVFPGDVQGITGFVSLIDSPAGAGFFVPDSQAGKLTERGPFAGTIANLAGEPTSGNLLEDAKNSPCLEPVLAELGSSHFTVVNTCELDEASGAVVWRAQFEEQNIELEPRASIDHGPLLVDLNGDGHLDVLVGAAGRAYVSYGDGVTLSVAIPYRLSLSSSDDVSPDIPMPLAAGDFTGDGAPDFVFPTHLLVSVKGPPGQLPSYFGGFANRLGAPWTVAKIADMNGNGKLDVVAASSNSLNVDFYNGNDTANITETTISTAAPVSALTVGDFDGDSINDVALMEPIAAPAKSSVLVAFGAPFAPPSAPVVVGQVTEPEQLVAIQNPGVAGLVVAAIETANGARSGALTFLDGDADRVLASAYTLTEFSSSGSVIDSQAFAVAAGNFSGAGAGDVLALAFHGQAPLTQLWLAPGIESTEIRPVRLTPNLDSALVPTTFTNLDFTADVSSASADLDGDGQDEAIFAMPAGANQAECGFVTVGAHLPGASAVNASEPILVAEPCLDPIILPVDADGDGATDLALLTGASSATDRKLFVFWNDRAGGFSSSSSTEVALGADSPSAFTVLPASPFHPVGFAYIAKNTVRLVNAATVARTFDPPVTLTSLPGGTGITASDVNGDGVVDLVLAASGKLSVLKARLEAP